jgi:hypothetical protein
MKITTHQEEKERQLRATLGRQLNKNSRQIIDEITQEIVLTAKKLTNMFLGDVFRNIFSLEKSCEYAAPVVFELGQDTDLIMYERLNPLQLQYLPYFIMNEEVMAKSFHPMREINFVIFIDMSLSMLYRWPLINLAAKDKYVALEQAKDLKNKCRKTKLYALKYLSYAFLDSAIQNDFKTSAIFFSNQTEHEVQSASDKMFPAFILHHIDEHFLKTYSQAVTTKRYSEAGGCLEPLLNFIHKRKKCVVLFLSDFLEGIEELKPYLIELNSRVPLVIGVINDPYEIEFPSRKMMTPITISHEHCKNMEENIDEGVRLSHKMIRKYNLSAAKRRKDIFDFFNRRKIKFLDIQTQNNDMIPQELQKFNAQLIGEL